MSLQYLLDGYNVINQIPTLAQKKLEDSRRELVSLIERCRPQGSLKNSVTIVFDGKSGIWGSAQSRTVKVIFTTDESADDKIKRIVSQSKQKKQIIVVTNDRDIKYDVRPQGAKVISVEEFAARLQPAKTRTVRDKRKSRTKTIEPKKNISKTDEFKITEELEQIWLKETRHKKQ